MLKSYLKYRRAYGHTPLQMNNMDLSKEPIIVVDKDDNELEILPRKEAEADKSKIIRMVYIFLYNPDEQILLQRRHADLERFPNYWEVSASGAVRPGEGYVQAAERKLQDELGLSTKLFHEHKFLIAIPGQASHMAALFIGEVKDLEAVHPNQVKVSEVRWLRPEEAEKGYLLTPAVEQVLRWWKERGENVMKTISRDSGTTM